MYTTLATSNTPALIIYLIDVSGSMGEPFDSISRIGAVSAALQKVVVKMIQRSTRGAIVTPRYRIAMYAYSSQVIDLLGGIKTIDELAKSGLPQLTPFEMTNTVAAFEAAEELLKSELPKMQNHPAPIVCHLTDGGYDGKDLTPIAQRITAMSVPDGNVLLENIYIKSDDHISDARMWSGIGSANQMPDALSQKLFNISTPIPDSYQIVMQEFGYRLDVGVRMFFPVSTLEMIELGFAMSGATPVI